MKPTRVPNVFPVLAGVLAFGAAGLAQAQEVQARVINSTPVIQQVAVPRQVCQDEQFAVPGQKSGAGAIMGGIAGGALGNAIGNGSGRAAATVIGLLGGAMLGNNIEGSSPSGVQTVRNCGTQTFYENQTVAYDVVYELGDRQYRTQMQQDPGPFVRLNVSPVGALPAPATRSVGSVPRVIYQQPEVIYQQPQVIYQQPQVFYQQPQVIYPAPVTRVTIGTQFVPSYPVGPQVIYINGVRQAPGYQRPGHSWHDDGDHSKSQRPRFDRDGDGRPGKWQRH
jgi:uncharacterized protein YcfJ